MSNTSNRFLYKFTVLCSHTERFGLFWEAFLSQTAFSFSLERKYSVQVITVIYHIITWFVIKHPIHFMHISASFITVHLDENVLSGEKNNRMQDWKRSFTIKTHRKKVILSNYIWNWNFLLSQINEHSPSHTIP